MAEYLGKYGDYTIDRLIDTLQRFKEEMGGDTKIYLSDFEYNGKQTQLELSKVEGHDELYIFYEANEELWD